MGLPGLVIAMILAASAPCPEAKRDQCLQPTFQGDTKEKGEVCLPLGGGVIGLGTETSVDPRVKSGLHKSSHV